MGGAVLTGVAGGGIGYAWGRGADPAAPADPAAVPAGDPKFRSRPDLRTLPDVTITTAANGAVAGSIFLTPASGAGLWGPLIVDEQGSPVWFRKVPDPATVAIDLKAQTYRDQPVLTWWEGTIGGTGGQGVGQGEFVIADRSYREITRIRAAGTEQADQHDLVITPRNTALFWVYDPIPYDLTALGGPEDGVLHDGLLQEIDIATGRKVFEWRSSDHVGLDESYAPLPVGDSEHLPYDYFHANSVGLAADGNIIVSARHTWAVYKIDRRGGEVRWRIGGKKSDFQVDERTKFSWQHDFRQRRDGSYGLFDNGAGVTKEREYSRGVVFRVDEAAKRTTFVAEYAHPDRLSAPTQGSFRELADGGSFVGWGQMPHFTEHNADGSVRLAGHLPLDNQSYRAYKAEWTGTPSDQPALGLRVEGGNVIVSASWNGATRVARWRARWGTQPGALSGGTVEEARAGFETTLTISGTPEYVVAEALDKSGKVLGSSSAIPVRV
ncbi:arylsulfotransferase family protein [Paractinoplanes hotanensis]|uniref:Arylsulfotransferase family protein n=1 Tax=Paractinoplanes hotanensis TaxID=2906497 RepID=A0ABT0YAE2_9ACTN|nr:arylsulfotransferase family protein [Actinoplanes hotanensis]MCM4083006.1 arylsulfotransferase family protein [Actinoplanes hotanensis]